VFTLDTFNHKKSHLQAFLSLKYVQLNTLSQNEGKKDEKR